MSVITMHSGRHLRNASKLLRTFTTSGETEWLWWRRSCYRSGRSYRLRRNGSDIQPTRTLTSTPTHTPTSTPTPLHTPTSTPTPPYTPTSSATAPHIPVMAEEVVGFLAPRDGSVILDMTFGGGGHSRRLLEASPGVRLVCLDRDPRAHAIAQDLQKEYPGQVLPLLGKFSELPTLLTRLKIGEGFFDGVLMDLGVSSMQFDTPERGFMLSEDGPLDMRMDGHRKPDQLTAANILSHLDAESLYKVLKYYGEEKNARVLSRALVESRYLFQRLSTTHELANFVSSLMEGEARKDKLGRHSHPATKTFQALRILVNNELNELDYAMQLSHYYLRPSGVLTAISFHSLEDTIIKRHLQGVDVDSTPSTIGLGVSKHRTALSTYSRDEIDHITAKPWKQLTKHVILPSEEEVAVNPRARSAKLRPAVKL